MTIGSLVSRLGVPLALAASSTWTVPARAAPVPPPPPAAARGDDSTSSEDTSAPSTATDRDAVMQSGGDAKPPPPPQPAATLASERDDEAPNRTEGEPPKSGAPAFMWAGLGVSAGLSVGMFAGSLALIQRNKRLQVDLREAAFDSLQDGKPQNDIDPNANDPATGQPIDLCEAARREVPSEPGTVTNASVTRVCNKGDANRRSATALAITGGAFAASAVAIGVVIGVRAQRSHAAYALQRRGVAFGVAPTTHGVSVGTRVRF